MSGAAAGFPGVYEQRAILPQDSFISIDVDGVGEPDSIRFCQSAGLDYVSCSP